VPLCMKWPLTYASRGLRSLETSCHFILQAAAPDMGQAALDWLHRRAPLHEAPAAVKEDLEAAGISGLASVTPASVRCGSLPTKKFQEFCA